MSKEQRFSLPAPVGPRKIQMNFLGDFVGRAEFPTIYWRWNSGVGDFFQRAKSRGMTKKGELKIPRMGDCFAYYSKSDDYPPVGSLVDSDDCGRSHKPSQTPDDNPVITHISLSSASR